MNNIDKVYVIHYKNLTNRKENMINQLNKYGITNYEFVENYDRDTTSETEMREYFKLNNLSPAQICITISHISVYKKMIADNQNMCLIFEDDAILGPNFLDTFNSYMAHIPNDFELGFINDGCELHAQNITSDKIWFPSDYSRTCCAYIITKKACEKILPTMIPFNHAIDHELNTQIRLHSLKNYWCEPTIVTDGSGKIYNSSYGYWSG